MKDKNGFTLIELLAVIAILGLLVTIAGFSVTSILKKSKSDINDVQASRMIDAAKLIVMDKPDIFTGEDLSYVNGIDCVEGTYVKCMITKNGFKGYLDKTDNITGCVIVYYHSDDDFSYEYKTGESGEECVNDFS